MRRILQLLAILALLLAPAAACADSTSIVNLNGATPIPVVTPYPTPTPVATAVTTIVPSTGAPSYLPFILLSLIFCAGYAYARNRRQS